MVKNLKAELESELVRRRDEDTHIEGLFTQRGRVWRTLVIGGETLVHRRSFIHRAGCGGLVVLVKRTEEDEGME